MWIIAGGGLGNHLFCLAYSLHLNDELKLRIRIVMSNQELSKKIRFTINDELTSRGIRIVDSIIMRKTFELGLRVLHFSRSRPILKPISRFLNSLFLVAEKPWTLFEGSKVMNRKFLILTGYFQDVGYVERLGHDSRKVLNVLISPVGGLEIHEEDGKRIGVHIRRGDYKEIPEYGLLSNDYFMDFLAKQEGESQILVASDDEESINELGLMKGIVPLRNSIYSPLKTMEILSSCDMFLMSNSTFSFWIAWKIDQDQGTVFAPSPWFKNCDVPKTYLYLDKFKKISSVFLE